MTPIKKLKTKLSSIADAIRDRTGEDDKLTLDQMADEINYMPAGDDGEAYILIDESGNEIPAFLTKEAVDLTATANDIRLGSIAVTDDGVITGEKEIPSYYVAEGHRIITKGSDVVLPHVMYDYTKLQAVLCSFNTSLTDSVAVHKIAMLDNVYNPNSAEPVAAISKDHSSSGINFGIKNDSDETYILRFFMYKEMY